MLPDTRFAHRPNPPRYRSDSCSSRRFPEERSTPARVSASQGRKPLAAIQDQRPRLRRRVVLGLRQLPLFPTRALPAYLLSSAIGLKFEMVEAIRSSAPCSSEIPPSQQFVARTTAAF